MNERMKEVLCWNCREKVPYVIRKRRETCSIKGLDYEVEFNYAVCEKCGEEVTVPGLDDENEKRLDIFYREKNGLITIEQIHMLLDKYNIEKRPLSKLLGFGELTITRYLEGQMPSKRYSDILLKFLEDDDLMERQLESKKECITENAYRKVKETLSARKKLLNHTTKIEAFALYLLNSSYEITNLSLQKLLYYIKGFGYLFFGRDVLESRCEAWVHGPVFPIIYNKYKEFGKSIISNDYLLINADNLLPEKDAALAEYILGCFGIYNGVILREFTHRELPWRVARGELDDSQRSTNTMKDDDIKSYFVEMDKIYNLQQKSGVEKYIRSLGVL